MGVRGKEMQYIGYAQMEKLLFSYSEIDALLKTLKLELETISSKEDIDFDDFIYSQTIKDRTFNSVPVRGTGNITDKTGDIAITYKQQAFKEHIKLKNEIKDEILDITCILEKINISLNGISQNQREIIKRFYFDRLTWKQIAKELKIVERSAQFLRRKGINKMVSIARINVDLYNKVIGILEK